MHVLTTHQRKYGARRIHTSLHPLGDWYRAEEYHQARRFFAPPRSPRRRSTWIGRAGECMHLRHVALMGRSTLQ